MNFTIAEQSLYYYFLEYIKEYISLIPHKEKFSHPIFHEVLRHSVQKSNPFSATDTAEAWIAISTYASNLYTEPWRTEYREIRVCYQCIQY